MPIGSNPLVGSSKINSFGLFNKAIAIPSLCFIPIENLPAFLFPVFVRLTISRTSSILESGKLYNSVRTFRFSLAVRFSYIGDCSISEPISNKSFLDHGFSLYIISPDVGFIIPVSILSNVDFPAPFGPSNPYIEFFGTSKDISLFTSCFL